MKRLRVILLFLLLGAIVNVAVAWGCAAWVIPISFPMNSMLVKTPGSDSATIWIFSRYDAYGTTKLVAVKYQYNIVKSENVEVEIFDLDDEVMPAWSDLAFQMDEAAEAWRREAAKPEYANVEWRVAPSILIQKAYGFPFRSMYWNWENGRRNMNADRERGTFTYCIRIKARPVKPRYFDLSKQRALPLAVIPIGFALNTVISALLLWILIPGPFVLRRFIRRKRGLCVKCAYDLRGADHEACPECGKEIRKDNPA